MHDYFYHGVWRMDWGLGNPNKTAALVALLMLVLWSFAYIRSWCFWVVLILFTILGVALIHTFSRGGIVALSAGAIPIMAFSKRPWPWAKIVGVTISIWVMIGAALLIDAQDRFGQGVVQQDRSIDNRLDIWKEAPQMMVDAPNGWGLGNSGRAYMQWYQPLDHSEQYRTLVNSHLTWLVEVSWPLRFLYMMLWASVLMLCWPNNLLREISIPFGVWIAFAIAATFSSVAESPWLWVLPIVCFAEAVLIRARRNAWPKRSYWAIPFAFTSAIVVAIFIVGNSQEHIRGSNDYVVIGKGFPDVWILTNPKVMGQNYGHSIRDYLARAPFTPTAIGISTVSEIPIRAGQTVVLAGNIRCDDILRSEVRSAKKIILLNPFFLPQEGDLMKVDHRNVSVIFGEFSQSPTLDSWKAFGSINRIDGVGDFLPQWPQLVLSNQ